MDKLTHKIHILNSASTLIANSLDLIQKQFPDDKDVHHHLWRIVKEVSEMQKSILRNLDVEATDEKFKDIIKDLDNNV